MINRMKEFNVGIEISIELLFHFKCFCTYLVNFTTGIILIEIIITSKLIDTLLFWKD